VLADACALGEFAAAHRIASVILFFDRSIQMLGTILLVILILVLLGALPTWNHSQNWGYFPSGGLGLVVLVVVVLLLMGRI
jgi:hypothetical protein